MNEIGSPEERGGGGLHIGFGKSSPQKSATKK